MRLPGLDIGKALGPLGERMLSDSRRRRPEPMTRREQLTEAAAGAGLLLIVVATSAGFDSARDVDWGIAAALTVAFAIAARVRFSVGPGFTTPIQLILIPMLFELPPAAVPVAATLGYFLSKVPEVLAGRIHPDRLLVAPGDSWFAAGPALVFAIAATGAPGWGDSAIYLAAFAAQILFDFLSSTGRVWLAIGVPPNLQLRVLARVYMVDALLTPIGLMAAFAADGAPFRALLVLPLVGLMAIFAQEREANIENALQLSTAYRGTALLLGDVLEDKDAYTAHHSHGVVSLSLAVADRMRLDPAARRRVEFGALLHDIGKIAVPAEIINKPGPLDDREWAVMKLHTVEGQQMLDRVGGVLGEVGRVVRSSHEHYDGSGYPDGLAADRIPIEARIVSCCDAFSAMTTTRSYRRAMSAEAAREELLRNQGSQFDPDVVDALLAVLADQQVFAGAEAPDAGSPAPAHSST